MTEQTVLALDNIDLKQLETKGFVVIPHFLTADEIDLLVIEYAKAKTKMEANPIKNKNASVSLGPTPPGIRDKITNFLKQVNTATNLSVNHVFPGTTYFGNRYVKYNWHQDHDTYYMWQDSYNLLNFWIPIVKPEIDKSGISVIPFDAIMPLISDRAKERLIGRGAKKFPLANNKTVMRDDSVGDNIPLDINIEDIKQTPNMEAGDLLLMRGDAIHKTQDTLTSRVAVSIRACNADYLLSKEVFYNQCPFKKMYINNDVKTYKIFHENFVDKNFVKLREMLKNWI